MRIVGRGENHQPSIFIDLYRHKPQRHHTPRENYVTEAFAAVLSTNTHLLETFFLQVAQEQLPEQVYIDTQVPGKTGVFDIVVTGADFYYVIESKFTAPFSAGTVVGERHQLERYATELILRPETRKGIISITLSSPPAINLAVNLFTTRWPDVMRLCRTVQTLPQHSIAEFLTTAFVELLTYLKADRQIASNGRLLWKCELCGLETTGRGIPSHQDRHCSEYGYLIEHENERRREMFLARIAPYQDGINRVTEFTMKLGKIELTNYSLSERMFDLLKQEKIPPELWPYVGKHLASCFSHRAFARFQEEITARLQGIEPLLEPPMVRNTYENILCYLHREFRAKGHAAQQGPAADAGERGSWWAGGHGTAPRRG
jgi:hypothetical protein